jgi:pimeloyl-ACP methyl ester carboxylesterase
MKAFAFAAAASVLLLAAAPAIRADQGFDAAELGRIADNASVSAALDETLQDPERDEAHPASNRQLVIPSGPVRPELGRPAEMNALFFLAAGEGPKPTMLLLHGLPGNERNLDLAQAVRRAGWNVLTFTYRGAWGSEGTFSIQHAMEDGAAALAFLRSAEAARTYGIDPGHIVVAGHSMGGMAAALAATDNGAGNAPAAGRKPLAGLILLDAWDIAATAREVKAAGEAGRAEFIRGFDDIGHSLGPIGAADLADEVMRRGEQWSLRALAPRLGRQKVFILYAKHGVRDDNIALADAIARGCREPLDNACGGRLWWREIASDHAFADKRVMLAQWVVRWLEQLEPDAAGMSVVHFLPVEAHFYE